ncbi:MAG: tyrosine--tRNA ligase [Rhizobiales bacterium]|nr:tyrosine--tRNA ligase [Hyphomicrobiales bacterium]
MPAAFQSELMTVLAERSYLHQCSDPEGLDALAAKEKITGYIGFDATAPSLHAGSLIQIMMLHWMQETGHRPIALMGGGTTMIGDPSFKDEARKLLTVADIDRNLEGIRQVFSRFLDFEGGRALMINNADWLRDLNYIEFLRDVGRHFSVNKMLSYDSVKLRLDREQSLSFLEFNYMILQGYDFVELYRRTGCVLQMGGSDQWGNIVNGIDLGHKMEQAQFFALTSPLLTTASGGKMGKTAAGAVWLDAGLLSPYQYWQFWRNTEDADVARFLKLYTKLPLDEVARLAALSGSEINEAKKVLATDTTTLVHGRTAAEEAAEAARRTFEEGETVANIPTMEIDRGPNEEWKRGRSNTAILAASGLVSSNSEARRKIAEGAVRINDQVVKDPNEIIPWDRVEPGTGAFKVQLGKKKIALVKPRG